MILATFIKLDPLRVQRPFWRTLNTLFTQSFDPATREELHFPREGQIKQISEIICSLGCCCTHTLTKDRWTLSAFIVHCNLIMMTSIVCSVHLCLLFICCMVCIGCVDYCLQTKLLLRGIKDCPIQSNGHNRKCHSQIHKQRETTSLA